jgi:hypothetical protein
MTVVVATGPADSPGASTTGASSTAHLQAGGAASPSPSRGLVMGMCAMLAGAAAFAISL